jgi:hypothetical protein
MVGDAKVLFFPLSYEPEFMMPMSKFVSALTVAFILLGTTAHAAIAIVEEDGTSSGRADNTSSYAVNLPTGLQDGNLVVVAIASNINEPLSAEGYTAKVQQGFNRDANGCFEFYHVWKTGDSINPTFSRLKTGSDAYAVVAFTGVKSTRLVDTSTGTSSEPGTQINLPGITTHHEGDMDVYASCAEAGATFSSPSLGTIVVQQANTSSSVAISTYPQPGEGLVGTQQLFMDTGLVNGSAVIALIAAAPEADASSSDKTTEITPVSDSATGSENMQ